MADFQDFNIEIDDRTGEILEHYNGTVAVANTPVTVTATGSATILKTVIQNPKRGTYGNSVSKVLYISFDGGTNYISLARGSVGTFSGSFTNILIKASDDNTNYELVLWRSSL